MNLDPSSDNSDVKARSWAPQVVADSSGHWAGNGLRFAEREAAVSWVKGLSQRWLLVENIRVVACDDEPNR